MMLSLRSARNLSMILLVTGLMLTASGCSLFKHKNPDQVVPAASSYAPSTGSDVPAGSAEQRPVIGSTVEFPESAGVRDVHFDYDKSEIGKDQLAVLDRNLDYFKSHTDVKIMIEGHCDERGTEEYNLALGQRRAAAVQDYLLQNGIAADRLATVSKGKDQPLDPANNESAWAKNRRGHFMRMY
jgi:peptidoglycan-associated lipoprotein